MPASEIKYSHKTAWVTCLIASIAFFDSFFQFNALNSISRDLINNLHLTKAGFGVLSSMYLWGIVLFFIPAGILYDHYCEKKLLFLGVLLSAIITLCFGLVPNLEYAMIVRFLLGMTHALAFIGVIRFPAIWLKKKIELATSICLTLGLLGGLLSQAPFQALTQLIGWRESFIADGILGFFMATVILLFIKANPHKPPAPNINSKQLTLNVIAIFKNTTNWLQAVYAGFLNLPSIILGSAWGNLVLINLFHLSKISASNIVGMIFLGLLIGSVITGILANHLKNNKLIMISGSVASTLLLILLITINLNFACLMFLFLFLGLSMSTQILVYPSVIKNNHHTFQSTAIGFISIIIMGSGGLFQIFFGLLSANSSYMPGLVMLIITTIISGIVMLISRA